VADLRHLLRQPVPLFHCLQAERTYEASSTL
jgi:hypothetical protein